MATNGRLRFGDFELRVDSGELFRSGVPVKLQPQPARLLEFLARRSGEVVTREEIRLHLWGEETFVDFEHGLNFSIRQIRRALGDSAQAPRFLETIPRRGYRFLPPVRCEEPSPAPRPRRVWAGLAALVIFAALLLRPPTSRPAPSGIPRLAQHWLGLAESHFFLHDPAQAVVEAERAIAAAPELAMAHEIRANALAALGRHDEALASARRARALDPESQHTARNRLCYHLFLARRFDEAIRCGQSILDLVPADSQDGIDARRWVLWSAWFQGDAKTALAAARDQVEIVGKQRGSPPPRQIRTLDDFWKWDLDRLVIMDPSLTASQQAMDWIALCEPERAIRLLEQAAAQNTYWVHPFIQVDPRFDLLRENPRFKELLRRS